MLLNKKPEVIHCAPVIIKEEFKKISEDLHKKMKIKKELIEEARIKQQYMFNVILKSSHNSIQGEIYNKNGVENKCKEKDFRNLLVEDLI